MRDIGRTVGGPQDWKNGMLHVRIEVHWQSYEEPGFEIIAGSAAQD